MKKVKRIFKYATGTIVPEGAKYLGTVAQTQTMNEEKSAWIACWFVWHYFLVECDPE